MPRVTVCIPWRSSPTRLPPFRRTIAFWEQTGWPIVTADSDSEVFSAAQARNNAVQKTESEVVVIADADTIPPLENVLAAVEDPVGVTWPFNRWVLIPAEWVDRPYEEFSEAPVLLEYPKGLGAVMICRRDEYWRLGGQPSEFYGWGYEDAAFHIVAETLSSVNRMPGTVYSINHDQEPTWTRDESRNRSLIDPYIRAGKRPWLMRHLLKTREDDDDQPEIDTKQAAPV